MPIFAVQNCVFGHDDAKPHAKAALPAADGGGDYIVVKAFAGAWFRHLETSNISVVIETLQR